MTKSLITTGKALTFFMGLALLTGVLPIPNLPNRAVWRFLAELIPFLSIICFTIIFWLIEKRKIKLHILSSPVKNATLGIVIVLEHLF